LLRGVALGPIARLGEPLSALLLSGAHVSFRQTYSRFVLVVSLKASSSPEWPLLRQKLTGAVASAGRMEKRPMNVALLLAR
jgi:hypothetical protein